MPTTKTRINITADPATERALTLAAKRDRVPVATKAVQLLQLALEIEEDQIWAELALERLKHGKFISHEEAWRRALGR